MRQSYSTGSVIIYNQRRYPSSRLAFWCGLLLIAGCTGPATQSISEIEPLAKPPYDPSKAHLTLDQIEPAVNLPTVATAQEPPVDIPPVARRYFQAGRDRFQEELWGEAINELARALQIAPSMVDARLLLARASLLQGNIALARIHLEEVVQQRPNTALVHQLLGDIAWQEQDLKSAMMHFRRALLCPDAEPGRPETLLSHLFLGLTLHHEDYAAAAADQLTMFIEGVEAAGPALAASPELRQVATLYFRRATTDLGELYDRLGRPADAIAVYRRGLQRWPDDADLRTRLAVALAARKQNDEALAIAREMCLSPDGFAAGVDLLVRICATAGGSLDADDELVRLGRESQNPALLSRIVQRLEQRGRQKETAEILERLVQLMPNRLETRLSLARHYVALKKDREFLEQLAGAVSSRSDAYLIVSELLSEAAPTSSRRKALIDAIHRLSDANRKAAADPKNAVLLFLRGRLLALDGRPEEAAHFLAIASEADPTLLAAHATLAEVELGRKRWEAAAAACERAIAAGIREAVIYRLLGDAYDAMDDLEQAERAFSEAARLAPRDGRPLLSLVRFYERRGNPVKQRLDLLFRIVQEVDVNYHEAREALILTFLGMKNLPAAREQLIILRQLGAPMPMRRRLTALVRFETQAQRPLEERLEQYRKRLADIIEAYPQEIEARLDLAGSYKGSFELEQALETVESALGIVPQEPRALLLKARLLAELLRYDESMFVFSSLLVFRPNRSDWLSDMAGMAVDSGRFEVAAAIYRQLLERKDLAAQHESYRDQLMETLWLAKDHTALVRTAEERLAAEPENLQARIVFLRALTSAERKDDALETARNWWKSKPDDRNLRMLMLNQLLESKRAIEAQQLVLSWMGESPDDEDLFRAMFSALYVARDWDSIIEILQTMVESPGADAMYERMLGQIYVEARRFEDAIEYTRSRLRGRDNEAVQNELLRFLIWGRQYLEAEKLAERLASPYLARLEAKVPFDIDRLADLFRQLGTIYQFSGRMDKCYEMHQRVLALQPTNPGAHNDLGYMWADAGKYLDRAENMIRFAVGRSPRNSAFLDSLGWVYYKKDDMPNALKYLRLAVQFGSDSDPVIFDHLGDALYRVGQVEEAVREWQRAVEAADAEDRIRTPEDDRVAVRCRAKLDAVERGDTPETAEVIGSQK
jgi:tetratricopeptide (TPR) repeat protein